MRIEQTNTEGFDGYIIQMEIANGTVIHGIQDSLSNQFTWFDNLTDAVCHGMVDYKRTFTLYKRNSPAKTRCARILDLLRNRTPIA